MGIDSLFCWILPPTFFHWQGFKLRSYALSSSSSSHRHDAIYCILWFIKYVNENGIVQNDDYFFPCFAPKLRTWVYTLQSSFTKAYVWRNHAFQILSSWYYYGVILFHVDSNFITHWQIRHWVVLNLWHQTERLSERIAFMVSALIDAEEGEIGINNCRLQHHVL